MGGLYVILLLYCTSLPYHSYKSRITLGNQVKTTYLYLCAVKTDSEAERRRRKQVEGMLDDARREYRQPHVVPAMMDAFEKIAALTGEALMAVDDEEI